MNRAVASESCTSLEGVEPTARNGAPLRPDGARTARARRGRGKGRCRATAASSAAAAASAADPPRPPTPPPLPLFLGRPLPHGTSGAHGTPSPVAPAIDEQSRFTGIGKMRGINFERRWDARHPPDEIEWELRTANIANQSGKTVFGQDGC